MSGVVGKVVELSWGAPPAGGNPYDTRETGLMAEIRQPDGSVLPWPVFACQSHRLDPVLENPKAIERALPDGTLELRLRFVPAIAGQYLVTMGEHRIELNVIPGDAFPGYIRWGRNGTHFARDNGELFFPIGANFCWPTTSGVFTGQKLADLFLMLRKLRDAGGTAYRLWANTTWAGLTIDWMDPADGKPLRFGQINQAGCAKLDAIVEESERLGLGIMFCIDNMNIWAGNKIETSSYWHENGGPCRSTHDYFNIPEARAMTREKMKYIAARWGHSPAIWSWEFWNEIDGCNLDKVTTHSMLAWHQEMAQALRSADPVEHPITTSCGHPLDFPAMWRIPELEFTQTHHYGYKDSVDDIVPLLRGYHDAAMKLWGKPHMFGELGISWCGEGYAGGWEKDGRTLHNIIWSTALLPGSCGSGFYWYWDGYIHANNLYPRFTGLSKFLQGERWQDEPVTNQEVALDGVPERIFSPSAELKVPTCLSGTDYVQSTFTILRDGTVPEGNHLIPNLFHGKDQPLYRFRISLHVDYKQAGKFTVMVWGGGANLSGGGTVKAEAPPIAELRLDGEVALSRPVVTLKVEGVKDDYCDRLTIHIPAGRHEIAIENIGGGVFHTGHYLLEGYLDRRALADAQAMRVGDQAYLWVRNTEHTWPAFIQKREWEPITGVTARLPGWLAKARVRVEWWDTERGIILSTDTVTAESNGVLSLNVPSFRHDVAAKIIGNVQLCLFRNQRLV